jgi:HEPN domain-containing protein
MSGGEPRDPIQWEEALRWLDKAVEDIAAASLLLRERLSAPAAFHAQQGLEKVLKALLVAAAQDLRRTHDLDALASEANKHWPSLIASPFPLAALSRWYLTSRYPASMTYRRRRMKLPRHCKRSVR